SSSASSAASRFARTRPRRSASCGCAGCATRPTSTSASEPASPPGPARAAPRASPSPPMSGALPIVAVTSGEPAGIGPDICAMLARREFPARVAVLGDPDLLADRARRLGIALDLRVRERIEDVAAHSPGGLDILAQRTAAAVVPGRLDPANADYVVGML